MIYEAQRKRIGGLALDSHSCRETDSTYLPMLKARRLHRTWVLSNVKRVQPLCYNDDNPDRKRHTDEGRGFSSSREMTVL